MEQLILKPEIVEAIKDDAILFGKVAAAMNLRVRTMYDLILTNPPRLANASVLKVLREHLNIKKDSDLLTEMAAA